MRWDKEGGKGGACFDDPLCTSGGLASGPARHAPHTHTGENTRAGGACRDTQGRSPIPSPPTKYSAPPPPVPPHPKSLLPCVSARPARPAAAAPLLFQSLRPPPPICPLAGSQEHILYVSLPRPPPALAFVRVVKSDGFAPLGTLFVFCCAAPIPRPLPHMPLPQQSCPLLGVWLAAGPSPRSSPLHAPPLPLVVDIFRTSCKKSKSV